jgi:predicted O-methyltransferase YrrM
VNLKRNYIGIEQDEKYVEIARKRVREAEVEMENVIFSGYEGVYFDKRTKKWLVKNGNKVVGTYDEAIEAYRAQKKK